MAKSTIYARHALPFDDEDENFQTFGDLRFYRNGAVCLGPTHFAARTPIHLYRFGANLVASRSINQPKLLEITTPFGQRLRFLYSRWLQKWYQVVEVEDPRLFFIQERLGTRVAVACYYVGWFLGWAVAQVVQLIVLCVFFFVVILLLQLLTSYLD